MSASQHDTLDLQEIIARIDRAQAETSKLIAEQAKLTAEQLKFGAEQAKFTAEQFKLTSESRKLDRDRWLAPFAAFGLNAIVAAVIGALFSLYLRR